VCSGVSALSAPLASLYAGLSTRLQTPAESSSGSGSGLSYCAAGAWTHPTWLGPDETTGELTGEGRPSRGARRSTYRYETLVHGGFSARHIGPRVHGWTGGRMPYPASSRFAFGRPFWRCTPLGCLGAMRSCFAASFGRTMVPTTWISDGHIFLLLVLELFLGLFDLLEQEVCKHGANASDDR